MAACCYFGVNLRSQLDRNFLSSLTDGTLHSCFDLVFSSPFELFKIILRPNSFSRFYLDKFVLNSVLPFSPLGQTILSPTPFPSLPLRIKEFYVYIFCSLCSFWTINSSPTPIPEKCSKSIFLSDSEKFPLFCLLFTYTCHWILNGVH